MSAEDQVLKIIAVANELPHSFGTALPNGRSRKYKAHTPAFFEKTVCQEDKVPEQTLSPAFIAGVIWETTCKHSPVLFPDQLLSRERRIHQRRVNFL